MVFLANLVALGFSRFSFLLYAPLFVSLGFLYFFPTQNVLSWPFFLRLTYSLVVIPLPIFFAGLIFSTTFRDATDPSLALGSNLLGAMVGGICGVPRNDNGNEGAAPDRSPLLPIEPLG